MTEPESQGHGYLGPKRLLAELGLPLTSGWHAELALATAVALDPIQRLLHAAGGSFSRGQQPAAMFHLFARSISDLVAGLHLLSHCYVQQAHSVIRPVQENCDLLDLFAARPEAAGRWMDPETPWTEFSPKAVREQLGQRKADEWYAHFSEIGPHPRFAGMRVAGGILRNAEGNTRAIVRIGPFFPEHPATLSAYLLVLYHGLMLALRGQYLVPMTTRVTMLHWLKSYRDCLEASASASKQVRAALVEVGAGEGTEFLGGSCEEPLERVNELIAEEKAKSPMAGA